MVTVHGHLGRDQRPEKMRRRLSPKLWGTAFFQISACNWINLRETAREHLSRQWNIRRKFVSIKAPAEESTLGRRSVIGDISAQEQNWKADCLVLGSECRVRPRRKNRSFEKSGVKERVMSWEAAGNRHYRVLFILLRKLEFVPLSLGAGTFLHRSMISLFLWNRWVTLVRVWSRWVMFGNTLAVGKLFGSLLTHSLGWRGQRLSTV